MKKQFNYFSIIALLCIVSLTSCEKMPDVSLPPVVTTAATNIKSNEAVLNATFTFEGDRSFKVRRAFEISDSEATLSNHQYYYDTDWTTLTGVKTIAVSVNSLSPNTTYYYRAVLFPVMGEYSQPIYGNVISFKTAEIEAAPSVSITLEKVTSITSTTARGYVKCSASNVTITGVGTIINKGQVPTIDNNLSRFNKSYTNSFRVFWSLLSPATDYYVRAYAKDSNGKYYYSNVLTFTTKAEPGGSLTIDDFVGTYTLNAYSQWEKKNISWSNIQFSIYKGDTLNVTGWDNNSRFKAVGVFDKGMQVVRLESDFYFEDLSFSYGDSTVYALFTPIWYNSTNNRAYYIESGGKSTYGEIWVKKTSANDYVFVACDGDSDEGYYANGFFFSFESVKNFFICGNSHVYTNVTMKRTSTSTTNMPGRASAQCQQIIKQQKQPQHHETEGNYSTNAD